MKQKKAITIILIVLALLLLAAGAFFGLRAYRAQKQQQALDAVEEVTGARDAEGLAELEQFRNLKRADLSGSTDLAAVTAFAAAHPQVEVLYTVDLGGTVVDNRTETLELEKGAYSLSALEEGLAWLPALRTLYLQEPDCSPEELEALRLAYPEKTIGYTVNILGERYDGDTETLDLTALTSEALPETVAALQLLPKLQTAQLTDEAGNNKLSLAELAALQQAAPQALFRYRFPLFGQEVSTEDERIEYIRTSIGNAGVEQLRVALPVLTRCRYFLLDDCGIDNEVLAELREEFPDTKIVWRVHISYLDFLTDVKVIHLTFLLTNGNAQVMRYCNEVEYLDIGHNTISNITFMGYMPELKYVILSYNNVRDLSPLANCKKLEMLELYFCWRLTDISPLAACESLQLLNISATGVRDITPAFGLKNLQRFYCIMNKGIPAEQMAQAYEELPDCWITFEQNVSKNVGWSFDAAGGVRAQWYLDMYKILRYRVEDWFFGDLPE